MGKLNNNYGYSWFNYYSAIDGLRLLSPSLKIFSNHIPSREFSYSLLEDFCVCAEVNDAKNLFPRYELRSNDSFSPLMCEAIALFLSQGGQADQHLIPGPHSNNEIFRTISSSMKEAAFIDVVRFLNNDFIRKIKNMIDAAYYEENIAYCELVGASKNYFSRSKDIITQDILLPSIEEEIEKRSNGNVFAIQSQLLDCANSICEAYF